MNTQKIIFSALLVFMISILNIQASMAIGSPFKKNKAVKGSCCQSTGTQASCCTPGADCCKANEACCTENASSACTSCSSEECDAGECADCADTCCAEADVCCSK